MAVEARHLNLFHPQFIPNREFMNNPIEGDMNNNLYHNNNNQMGYGFPLSGTTTAEQDTLFPAFNSITVDSKTPSPPIQSDSGLTYHHHHHQLPFPRKRSRDSLNLPNFPSYPCPPQSSKSSSSFSFLGQDISLQIHQHQIDIDHLVSQHLEKVRSEVEEKRKKQARRVMELIEVGMMKRLKAKEEEIEKIGKLNWALEERVKSLSIENQIWRDMAQTNEAAVNALRTNLEQVLYHGGIDNSPTALLDDAQSSCGSNDNDNGNGNGWGEEEEGSSSSKRNSCRNCGKEESSVLLLPCRHLCLCNVCGSSVHICPICKSIKNASVHVNMS